MSHLKLVDTTPLRDSEFVSTFDTQPLEAASACSDFLRDEQQPKPVTVGRWTRVKRAVRRWLGEPTVKL